MGHEQIQTVEEMRDLGVVFDSQLTFVPHIEDVIRRITAISGAMHRFVKEIRRG